MKSVGTFVRHPKCLVTVDPPLIQARWPLRTPFPRSPVTCLGSIQRDFTPPRVHPFTFPQKRAVELPATRSPEQYRTIPKVKVVSQEIVGHLRSCVHRAAVCWLCQLSSQIVPPNAACQPTPSCHIMPHIPSHFSPHY